jgi:hypothetical protein
MINHTQLYKSAIQNYFRQKAKGNRQKAVDNRNKAIGNSHNRINNKLQIFR